MNWYNLTDQEVLLELVVRIKRKRLNINMTQRDLAAKAGMHFNSVVRLENGKPVSILTFIQILRALDELDGLDKFIPDPGISPIKLFEFKGKEKQRASKKRNSQES